MDILSDAMQRALYAVLLLSAPPVIVATTVGLIVGIFQTVTQLQEQTLPFGVKMLCVLLVLGALGGWYATHLEQFARLMFSHALDT